MEIVPDSQGGDDARPSPDHAHPQSSACGLWLVAPPNVPPPASEYLADPDETDGRDS